MHKIGILSDTHGLLRPEVLEALEGCDYILHGGDINKQSILDRLNTIAPVIVVRGNNDKEWAKDIPETFRGEIGGLHIFMVHNKKYIPEDLQDTDLIIYGHSHRYEEKRIKGTRCLNPGSCGPRRFHQEITLAILHVGDDPGEFFVEKVLIPHKQVPSRKNEKQQEVTEKLPAVMKDLEAGKTVEAIAKKHNLSMEISREITRMYLTHPGIDMEGILNRLE